MEEIVNKMTMSSTRRNATQHSTAQHTQRNKRIANDENQYKEYEFIIRGMHFAVHERERESYYRYCQFGA